MNQVLTLTTIQQLHKLAHKVKHNVCSAQLECNVHQEQKLQLGQLTKEVSTQPTIQDIFRSIIVQAEHSLQNQTLQDHSLSAHSAQLVHTVKMAQQLLLHAQSMLIVPLEVLYSQTVQ